MTRRRILSLGGLLSAMMVMLLVVETPAWANSYIFRTSQPYSSSSIHLNLVLNTAGTAIRAECGIHNGTAQRRIRGCNVIRSSTGQPVTSTANIDPNWPAWTRGTAAAQSTWASYGCAWYYVAILFDYGSAQRVSRISSLEANGC